MNAIISRIFIFGENNEKRVVSLEPGLNIITGDSKTGKSAILEIVDYCLFSSRSTIPKGVIEDFAELYAVVLALSEKYIVIARPSAKTANDEKAYVRVESDGDFLTDLTVDYFNMDQCKPLKQAQAEVERHLGISVLDTREDPESSKQDGGGKVTLRSFASLIFQHQNLIANKHSIFYRFEDFYKRQKTIQDFPVLMGWESAEYFSYARELEQKRKELKANKRMRESMRLKGDELREHLVSIIDGYYAVIGLELDKEMSLEQLKGIANNLPSVGPNSYSNVNLKLKIGAKNEEREDLRCQLADVELLESALEENSSQTYVHSGQLKFLEMTSQLDQASGPFICPVCHQDSPTLSEELFAIANSHKELQSELAKMGSYKEDNTQQLEGLRKKRDSLKRGIRKITSEIELLEQEDLTFQSEKLLRDQGLRAKGAADMRIQHLLERDDQFLEPGDDELKQRIAWLERKIEGYDLKSKIKDAEFFLSQKMTEICSKLDFEEELKPGILRFSLKDFAFYYYFKDEKIHLSEMGSGANWLACHLSLFLGLLHLNCRTASSVIPSFLFIDQPSQVYFPAKYGTVEENGEVNVEENIKQVLNIFRVIIDELDLIAKDCGFFPQVVVMEHADEPEFKDYVRRRWTKDGEKLI